ncbi:TPA: 4-oxalocrotonate tautomerase family protein [Kluyvera ascorbata]|nr:4-oxalocrotonate tautomerase family protein [Kluyvera ascorbata]
MPYINVKIAKVEGSNGLSADGKSDLIEKITAAVESVTGRPRNLTMVLIEEVEAENWGIGGVSADKLSLK